MLIRSKLHRNGGTRVELGKGSETRHYHFKPLHKTGPDDKFDDPNIEHVCNITDADDLAIFLAIKEAYAIHSSELTKPAAAAMAKNVDKIAQAQSASDKNHEKQRAAATAAKPYGSLQKPDLIKRIAERTGKAPHGTTPRNKLIETLEKLDAKAK